jgi:hypothetical protein
VDAVIASYNTDRPHQSLDMDFPIDRFRPRPFDELGLRLPPALLGKRVEPPASSPLAGADPVPSMPHLPALPPTPVPLVVSANGTEPVNLAVEIDRTVPASGNLGLAGHQFWFGPQLGGVAVTLWMDTTVVHIVRDGVRVKTIPSRFTTSQLRRLLAEGGRIAASPPAKGKAAAAGAVEVDRLVNGNGLVGLAGRQHPIGYHLAGQRVTVRLDGAIMQILDHDRTLLRSLPNPLQPDDRRKIRDARPAGTAPHVPELPPAIQRRVSCRGAIMVAGQRIQVGFGHAGITVTVAAAGDRFQVYDDDRMLVEVARTTTKPIARYKARKPEPPRRQAHSGGADA